MNKNAISHIGSGLGCNIYANTITTYIISIGRLVDCDAIGTVGGNRIPFRNTADSVETA